MADLILREWNGCDIRQRADGYLCLTDMAKSENKDFSAWKRLPSTQKYLEGLAVEIDVLMGVESGPCENPMDQLIVTVTTGKNEDRMTWGHELVAIELARWCSVPFAIQCNRWILDFARNGSVYQHGVDATEVKNFQSVEVINVFGDGYSQQFADLLNHPKAFKVLTAIYQVIRKDRLEYASIRREFDGRDDEYKAFAQKTLVLTTRNKILALLEQADREPELSKTATSLVDYVDQIEKTDRARKSLKQHYERHHRPLIQGKGITIRKASAKNESGQDLYRGQPVHHLEHLPEELKIANLHFFEEPKRGKPHLRLCPKDSKLLRDRLTQAVTQTQHDFLIGNTVIQAVVTDDVWRSLVDTTSLKGVYGSVLRDNGWMLMGAWHNADRTIYSSIYTRLQDFV